MTDQIRQQLIDLYGETKGNFVYKKIYNLINKYSPEDQIFKGISRGKITERDSILITYGDQVTGKGYSPLQTLSEFCKEYLADFISGIHILPFFPYSSDDGFSVIDYRMVHPVLGGWEDIAALNQKFKLMFDAVINHVSIKSKWFRGFLEDDPKYKDYFMVVNGNPDLSRVVRPRALPLLTGFDTPSGSKQVWTTFSSDQVDLNYANPEVLFEVIDLLLFYIRQGAEFIRMDAIAYIWKEIGTTCISLPQTHQIIKIIRSILDLAAPQVFLITETNVPHQENLSYWGNGRDEAQLVYNFALPPLVLHTLQGGNTAALKGWAKTLQAPSQDVTFFNFLASHDGIGLNPVRDILTDTEINRLVDNTIKHGGLVSYKQNSDGSQSPYELNINYFDALNDPGAGEPLDFQINRFMVGQAIMLALKGMPGIYFHSIFGSTGWPEGVQLTGRNRSINRQKFEYENIEKELLDPSSRPHLVLKRYQQLLKARSGSVAFHPNGAQQILELGQTVFALLRSDPEEKIKALCIHNVTDSDQAILLDERIADQPSGSHMVDIITGVSFKINPDRVLLLKPYQVIWLI
jgi:glucosylglycerate phosphorylase